MWVALALASAFLTAVLGTVTKVGLEKVDPFVAIAVQVSVLVVLAWALVAFQGRLGDVGKIEGKSWGYLVAAGALMMAGYVFYFRALGSGPSSGVQPLDRLSLVFAVGLAAVFLKEKVSPLMIVGVVLMSAGAIMIAVGAPKK